MERGTVRFFDGLRGFGFVAPDAGGGDLYVPGRAVELAGLDDLPRDTRVEFERVRRRDGRWQAHELRVVGEGHQAAIT